MPEETTKPTRGKKFEKHPTVSHITDPQEKHARYQGHTEKTKKLK